MRAGNDNNRRHIAPADYRPGSHLRLILAEMITEIADNIVERRRSYLEAATVHRPLAETLK